MFHLMKDKHQFWSLTENKIKDQFSIHTNKLLLLEIFTQNTQNTKKCFSKKL
jgi:hypothetical protein